MTFSEGSGDTPVLVMKTAKVREGDDLSSLPVLDEARLRALLVQREMGSCRVVVSEVGAQEPLEMAVVVDDDVIEALAPNRADQAFDIGILPGVSAGRSGLLRWQGCAPGDGIQRHRLCRSRAAGSAAPHPKEKPPKSAVLTIGSWGAP